MKVICISHQNFSGIPPHKKWDIEIGEEKTVSIVKRCMGIPCFGFIDIPGWLYDQRNFAVISDIDETELVAEREAAGV